MATIRFNDNVKTSMLNQVKTACDAGGAAGTIKVYSGTLPATPETAIGAQILLGTLTLTYNPCGAVSGSGSGLIFTYSTITQDSSADATGTAAFARFSTSAGTVIFDCDITVTGAGGVLQLNTTNIVSGGPIQVTAFTLAIP